MLITAIASASYPSLPRAATSQPGFLLPYLQYGPNNQFLQLMEAAVAAKALGRALLVPSFRAWVQDETSSAGSLIRFEDTWDVDELSNFVQLAHPPSRTSTLTGHTLVALADYKQKATEDYLRVQRLPCCPKKKRIKGAQVSSTEQVRRLARDAGVGPQQPLIGWYSFFTTARPQLVEAARHFRRAAPIRTHAERVAEALFGGEPFLAVHLRREMTDLGCAFGHPTVLCPKDGAQWTIETPQVLREIKAVQERSGLRHVYIATIHPPMVAKYAHELDTLLQARAPQQRAQTGRAWPRRTALALERLVAARHGRCRPSQPTFGARCVAGRPRRAERFGPAADGCYARHGRWHANAMAAVAHRAAALRNRP